MKVGIVGNGSWGIALTQVLVDNKVDTIVYGRILAEVEEINQQHTLNVYFDDYKLDEGIRATNDFKQLDSCDIILLAIPSTAISVVVDQLNNLLTHPVTIINVAKGFHPETYERLSVVIKRLMNPEKLKAVVSLIGPSHAEEVIKRLLTTVNAVSDNEEAAYEIQNLFSNDYFRVYRNNDVIGAEIGVAIKNIMAIASGILSGINQGDNARAALMTRGLAEMSRYGEAFGAKKETFLGLCGVGDLIVTCTSLHSRNFQAGLAIGKANSAKEFLHDNKKTVEGISACNVIYHQAKEMGISMPIVDEIYNVLFNDAKPTEALARLMLRELKAE